MFVFAVVTSGVVVLLVLFEAVDANKETVDGEEVEDEEEAVEWLPTACVWPEFALFISLVNERGDMDFRLMPPDDAMLAPDVVALALVVVVAVAGFKLIGIVFLVGSLFSAEFPLLTIPFYFYFLS